MWHWPSTGAIPTTENALEEYFDSDDFTFADTLVREAIQNSLDARLDESQPVSVSFSFHQSDDGDEQKPYLEKLFEYREFQQLRIPDEGFAEPKWLLIQDSNTTGLLGDLTKRDSDFWNYWLNFGRSNKGHGSRGRHGAGRITFLMASQINAVLGVTQRDSETVLCGMAGLRTATYDDHFRAPMAIYAKKESGDVWSIWNSDGYVDQFLSSFNIQPFDAKPGFALVVPYPYEGVKIDQLKAAVIEHFAPAIISSDLRVEINGSEINADTIEQVAVDSAEHIKHPSLQENPVPYIRFLKNAISKDPILFPIPRAKRIRDLGEDELPMDKVEELKSLCEGGHPVMIKIEFPLALANGSANTSLSVAIQKPPEEEDGIEMYFRQGMSMPGKGMAKMEGRVHGAVMADESTIADYLNICEGKAHLTWGQTQKVKELLAQSYGAPVIAGRDLAVFALRDIASLIIEEELEQDPNLLKDFFAVELEGGGPNPKGPNVKPQGPDGPERSSPLYSISRSDSGFLVRQSPNAKLLPESINVSVAYADGRANPQRRWSSLDFELENLVLEVTKCSVSTAGNELVLTDLEEEFEVKITGFDIRRELDLKARARSREVENA